MMTLSQKLQNSKIKYSPTIICDLIRSNRKKYGYVNESSKEIIFYMVKRIVVRCAKKYVLICNNRGTTTQYTFDDIVQEMYLICSRCVDLFVTEDGKDFYLYFNSAANRRVSRMANYKKVVNGEITFTKASSTFVEGEGLEFSDMVEQRGQEDMTTNIFEEIGKLGLNYEEMKLVTSINRNEKHRDILKEAGITKAEYNQTIKVIREKLKNLYDENLR